MGKGGKTNIPLLVKGIDPTLLPLIVEVIGLVVQYAVPEAIALIEALQKKDITIEDIRVLKDLVQPAENY